MNPLTALSELDGNQTQLLISKLRARKLGFAKKTSDVGVRAEHSQAILSAEQQAEFRRGSTALTGPSGFRWTTVELTGRLDYSALRRALREIICRHEILRRTYRLLEGQLVAEATPPPDLVLEIDCVTEMGRSGRLGEIEARVRKARRSVGDAHGFGNRAILLKFGAQDHVLLLRLHRLVADGWSMAVLIGELGKIYEAFVRGEASPLEPLAIQYSDYVAWQQGWLKGEEPGRQLAYWRRRLAGAEVLELPTDRPRPAAPTFEGSTEHFEIDAEATAGLKVLSQRLGVTLFMALLAIYKALLSVYTKQTDISVGTLIANRNRRETEGLVGLFVNTLVLRTNLSGADNFVEIVRRVSKTCLEAYDHQDVPFGQVAEDFLASEHRPPLLRAMFALQTIPMRSVVLKDLTLTPIEVDCGTAEVDVYLYFKDTPQGLRGWLEYNRDLFNQPTIARFVDQFVNFVKTAIQHPEAVLPVIDSVGQRPDISMLDAPRAPGHAHMPGR